MNPDSSGERPLPDDPTAASGRPAAPPGGNPPPPPPPPSAPGGGPAADRPPEPRRPLLAPGAPSVGGVGGLGGAAGPDELLVRTTPPWGSERPVGPPVAGSGRPSGAAPVVPAPAPPGGRPPGVPTPGAPNGLAGGPYGPVPAPHSRPGTGGRLVWALVVAALVGALVSAAMSVVVVTLVVDDDDGESAEAPVTTPNGAMDVDAILDNVQESVVTIETSGPESGALFGGAGTGVVLSNDGLVLTNAHVIAGSTEISVRLFDGSTHRASLVGSTMSSDLAMIRIEGVDDLSPATLGSSDTLTVGEPVIAIGNALNLGGKPTVTTGIVSALSRTITATDGTTLADLIQTDAAINRGNSGGPLVDSAGEVVGINTAILEDTQNIGFSIAIDSVRQIIDDLEQGNGEVTPDTPLLGVSTISLDTVEDAVTSQFDISADEGAFVVQVEPDSGAERAGLRQGDVILEVDGQPITSSEELGEVVRSSEVGDRLEIRIERNGEEMTVTAELGAQGG